MREGDKLIVTKIDRLAPQSKTYITMLAN
nr:hypothetical protein [Bacillus sp. ISL-101]